MKDKDREKELIYLKFQRRFSTLTLLKRFPWEKKRIAEIALLDVNPQARLQLIASQKIKDHLKVLERKLRNIQKQYKVEGGET